MKGGDFMTYREKSLYFIILLLFSLVFIYRVQKILVLFVLLGYVFVILLSNVLLKRLYNLYNIITLQHP